MPEGLILLLFSEARISEAAAHGSMGSPLRRSKALVMTAHTGQRCSKQLTLFLLFLANLNSLHFPSFAFCDDVCTVVTEEVSESPKFARDRKRQPLSAETGRLVHSLSLSAHEFAVSTEDTCGNRAPRRARQDVGAHSCMQHRGLPKNLASGSQLVYALLNSHGYYPRSLCLSPFFLSLSSAQSGNGAVGTSAPIRMGLCCEFGPDTGKDK